MFHPELRAFLYCGWYLYLLYNYMLVWNTLYFICFIYHYVDGRNTYHGKDLTDYWVIYLNRPKGSYLNVVKMWGQKRQSLHMGWAMCRRVLSFAPTTLSMKGSTVGPWSLMWQLQRYRQDANANVVPGIGSGRCSGSSKNKTQTPGTLRETWMLTLGFLATGERKYK